MDWEELVLKGLEAGRNMEGLQWQLGDLALQVETVRGEHTLEEYARSIGQDPSRLRHYKMTARAFEDVQRCTNLSYGHHEVLATRADRLDWLEKAAAGKWAVRQMLKEIEPTQIKPQLTQALEEVRQSIAEGEEPAVAVTNAVQKYGAPTPSQARMIAQETHIPVPGSDNRIHDGRPLELIERETAVIQRQQGLLEALAHIADGMGSPDDEAREWPSHLDERLRLSLNSAYLWLMLFREFIEERTNNV